MFIFLKKFSQELCCTILTKDLKVNPVFNYFNYFLSLKITNFSVTSLLLFYHYKQHNISGTLDHGYEGSLDSKLKLLSLS